MVTIKSIALALLLAPSLLQAKPTFEVYVDELKAEAINQGFSQAIIDVGLNELTYRATAVKSDKNQPEFRLTLDTYIPRAVPQWKVAKARRLYKEHLPLLNEIGQIYGVQPRFIVALWGVESNFGNLTGNYDVMSALATMAYEGRREEFFKSELFKALSILDERHIERSQFKGSWAGAMGQVQFMPSSFHNFAVDFNADGRKDIWQSIPDALGSAANYLAKSGWDDDLTWGRQVEIPDTIDESFAGLEQQRTLAQWQALGIRRYDGGDLPTRDIKASLVIPDDRMGRVYLVYENYRVLMRWNRSHYFAVAVGTLADRIGYPAIE